MRRNIYINTQGGLGFCCALASICVELKAAYDKVCICSPYSDIYEASPFVDYVYKPHEMRDFIFDAKRDDAKLICERMYDSEDFIYKKVSYADAWRKACGLKTHGNKTGSDIRSTLKPLETFPALQEAVASVLSALGECDDFVIMQFEGGQSPLVEVPAGEDGKPDWSRVPTNYESEPLKRHYPYKLAQEFIDLFKKAHPNTGIVMYQLPNEHQYNGTVSLLVPYMTYYLLAQSDKCRGTVSIDSSLQHLVAGVTKSVVLWGHSLPDSFGYEYNKNIVQDCHREDILYFSALGPSGARINYIKPEEFLKEVDSYLYAEDDKAE